MICIDQNYRRAIVYVACIACLVFLPYPCHAAVIINEYTTESPQKIELWNTGPDTEVINEWYLDDAGGTTYFQIPSTPLYELTPSTCLTFTSNNFNLNTTSADTVRLFDKTAPPTSPLAQLQDSRSYTTGTGTGVSAQRNPDGSNTWTLNTSSFDLTNETHTVCASHPTDSPTPTTILTHTPTPIRTPTSTPITTTPTLTPTSTGILSNTPTPTSPHSPTPYPTPTMQSTPPAPLSSTPSPTLPPSPTPTPFLTLLLNEVLPAPPDDQSEWIEIYNPNTVTVDLVGWHIDDVVDGGSTPIALNGSIPAYTYFVFDLPRPIFNNTGDTIRLIAPSGAVVELLLYDQIDTGLTWSRSSLTASLFCISAPTKASENTPCSAISTSASATATIIPTFTPTPTRTPTPTKTQTPTPTPTAIPPDAIYLSEIYPHPDEGENEWIELYNDRSTPVQLRDWSLDDAAQAGAKPLSFSLDIPAYGFAVIEFAHPFMNNSSDEVRLIRSDGAIMDHMSYTYTLASSSWSKPVPNSSSWCIQTPTKSISNTVCATSSVHTLTPTRTPTATRVPTRTPTQRPTPTTRMLLSTKTITSNLTPSVLGITKEDPLLGRGTDIVYTDRISDITNSPITPPLTEISPPESTAALHNTSLLTISQLLLAMMGGYFTWLLFQKKSQL